MSITICRTATSSDQATILAKQGIKSIELDISGFMQLPDKEHQLMEFIIEESQLKTPSFSGFLPPDVCITEAGFNSYIWDMHTKKVLREISNLGGESVCINNGPSKFFHWEFEQLAGKQQLIRYITTTCQYAQSNNINILLEPLVKGYTTHLISFEEICRFIDLVAMPNLGISIPIDLLLSDPNLLNNPNIKRITINAKHLQDNQEKIDKLLITLESHESNYVISMPLINDHGE